MDKRPVTISRMFDRIAPTYDILNTMISFSFDAFLRRALIKELGLRMGELALDIATGTGVLAIQGLKLGAKVVGVDISEKMLEVARKRKVGLKEGGRYYLVRCNACNMPFNQGSFKKVMVAFGIRNMDRIDVLFSEAYRVMDSEGLLVALEFAVPENIILKLFYKVYLGVIIPFIGGLISGDKAAYAYLRDSVMAFPSPEAVSSIIKDSGFNAVRTKKLMFGIACLYIAEK